MGTTSLGYRYPEPTDRARSGSVAIRALAEDVTASHDVDGAVVGYGDSGATFASGTTAFVDFPGTRHLMDGFTFDGVTLTRTGSARVFVIHAEVEVNVAGGSGASSSLNLLYNGAQIAGSFDRIEHNESDIAARTTVHTVTTPGLVSPGDTIQVKVGGAGAGNAGSCTLRVYSVSPAAI